MYVTTNQPHHVPVTFNQLKHVLQTSNGYSKRIDFTRYEPQILIGFQPKLVFKILQLKRDKVILFIKKRQELFIVNDDTFLIQS